MPVSKIVVLDYSKSKIIGFRKRFHNSTVFIYSIIQTPESVRIVQRDFTVYLCVVRQKW